MNYFNPANLGVIACPGGEVFADEVITCLKKVYRHSYNNMIAELTKHYGLESSEAIRQVNLINDALTPARKLQNGAGQYRSPHFKVQTNFSLFPNDEVKAEIMESIRGKDIYIFQDVENHYPVNFYGGVKKAFTINDHLMTILVTVDAARQAGADRVTLVVPVYPYSRQHKTKGREGLTAGRIGSILEGLGVNRIITLDIHSREINNAFKMMRLENLHASYQIIRALSKIPSLLNEDLVVVSPDTGAVDRNKFYAATLKKPLALIYKERDYSKVTKNALENNISDIKLLGDVKNKTVFIADDLLGTGGTLIKAMKFLKEQGAGRVIASVSLPLFTGNAVKYFNDAYANGFFYRIIGTNAVYHEELLKQEWYISVNVTKLFAQAIFRLHQGLSVSSLLDNRDIIAKLFQEPQSASPGSQ